MPLKNIFYSIALAYSGMNPTRPPSYLSSNHQNDLSPESGFCYKLRKYFKTVIKGRWGNSLDMTQAHRKVTWTFSCKCNKCGAITPAFHYDSYGDHQPPIPIKGSFSCRCSHCQGEIVCDSEGLEKQQTNVTADSYSADPCRNC